MAHSTDFPDSDGARETNLMTISWYLLLGVVFRAPVSTAQQRTEDGGLNLLDVVSKCSVLFVRFRTQGDNSRSLTAEWLKIWASRSQGKPVHTYGWFSGPFNTYSSVSTNGCIWNPIEDGRKREDLQKFVYDILRTIYAAVKKPRELSIARLQADISCSLSWSNLHRANLPDGSRSTWYLVIHVILPTNMRLYRIRPTDTDTCKQCLSQETVLHHFTDWGMRQEIWYWVRIRISPMEWTRDV